MIIDWKTVGVALGSFIAGYGVKAAMTNDNEVISDESQKKVVTNEKIEAAYSPSILNGVDLNSFNDIKSVKKNKDVIMNKIKAQVEKLGKIDELKDVITNCTLKCDKSNWHNARNFVVSDNNAKVAIWFHKDLSDDRDTISYYPESELQNMQKEMLNYKQELQKRRAAADANKLADQTEEQKAA